MIGATCSGPVRQVPDPPVGSGGTPPTFASPRNRMGGRIRPPSVVTGFLEGTSNPEPNTPTATRPTHRHPEARTSPGPPSCQCVWTIAWEPEGGDEWFQIPHPALRLGVEIAGKDGLRLNLDSAEFGGPPPSSSGLTRGSSFPSIGLAFARKKDPRVKPEDDAVGVAGVGEHASSPRPPRRRGSSGALRALFGGAGRERGPKVRFRRVLRALSQ